MATMRFPGFCDVHVHFREPGFSYKETIKTGSMAAAAGGYTAVCTMPNLNPVPDSVENLKLQLDIINKDAAIAVYPYAAITVGELGEKLADMEGMAPQAIAFSDDGKGVQSEEMMLSAMLKAKALGKVLAAHCEDNSLNNKGVMHDGEFAKAHGYVGIPSASEWKQIERDISLAKETGCAYHVCHISCEESVELIRKAKADGVNITCETAPHYLVLDDSMLKEEGRFKMAPPIRSAIDKQALLKGVIDGTIDMIATDHAPHSAEEKSNGFNGSPFGITGIETAFPVLYTKLVKPGIVSLDRIIEMLTTAPRKRFGIPLGDDYSVWELDEEYVLDSSKLLSMGHATPFDGEKLFGQCKLTVFNGKEVFRIG